MATSIFDKKEEMPTKVGLELVLDSNLVVWQELMGYLEDNYGALVSEWKYYSKNAGWCLRVANATGKNLVFLLPNDDRFMVNINMSVKVRDKVLAVGLSDINTDLLVDAKVYTEGVSILVDVSSADDLEDVKTILRVRDN